MNSLPDGLPRLTPEIAAKRLADKGRLLQEAKEFQRERDVLSQP